MGIRARLIGWTNDPKHPALPGLQAIVADRGYTGLLTLATSHGLNLDIKVPPAPPMLPPTKPGGKWRKGKRAVTPLRPLYKVENAFARLGMWRRLSRCYEQTALRCADLARGRVRRLPVRAGCESSRPDFGSKMMRKCWYHQAQGGTNRRDQSVAWLTYGIGSGSAHAHHTSAGRSGRPNSPGSA